MRVTRLCTAHEGVRDEPRLTLHDLEQHFRAFVFDIYHVQPHSETLFRPKQRWEAGGFLPQMPDSLEQLDLLLLTVAKPRKVRRDGIWFLGMRYLDTTLAAYVGESVIIRYDPRDVAEIRVFYQDALPLSGHLPGTGRGDDTAA